jgi:hypothetical protein
MIQLNQDDVCRLIRACEYYKEETGSEYMWDVYDKLQNKLRNNGEEVSTIPQNK